MSKKQTVTDQLRISYEPINDLDIKQFLAVILQMKYVILSTLQDYWSNDLSIEGHSICKNIMPKTNFTSIMRLLHFVDNNSNSGLKLYKIEQLV